MGLKVKEIILSSDIQHKAEDNNNVDITDVLVLFEDGQKYIASFFSYSFIDKNTYRCMNTGECLDGTYFWKKNMVLVKDCKLSTIKPVVKDLIDEGEFQEAFEML